jgi:hypothetical protein
MPTFWNPRLLLDVDPYKSDFSCTGTTKKGYRCGQTFIDRKAESNRILDSLSSKDVVTHGLDDRMRANLRILAQLTLCPRWRRYGARSQTNEVYLRWVRSVSNFITEERARMNEEIQRPVALREAAEEVQASPVPSERRSRLRREDVSSHTQLVCCFCFLISTFLYSFEQRKSPRAPSQMHLLTPSVS